MVENVPLSHGMLSIVKPATFAPSVNILPGWQLTIWHFSAGIESARIWTKWVKAALLAA
jgi:hypothetical protein